MGLSILVHATLVAATSHQMGMRKLAESLANAGHQVTLVEPEAADGRMGPVRNISGLTVQRAQVMDDQIYTERSAKGETFQRLSQEINEQLLPQMLPRLQAQHFDLAVVDALCPTLARALRLPSVHVQLASDVDAATAMWFFYGFASQRNVAALLQRLQFAYLWLATWLAIGSHQDGGETSIQGDILPWKTYFQDYILKVLVQGTDSFALPQGMIPLVEAHGPQLSFIGSLMQKSSVNPPPEAKQIVADSLALVAFGTKSTNFPCPLGILRGLQDAGLVAVVLVESCRTVDELPKQHVLPSSRDQAAWLREPRMRLAVVHGGINSLYEAVAAGLPIACVPHENDQFPNCREVQVQRLGWAVDRRAPAMEAEAAFQMLLRGGFTNARAAASFQAATGAESAVRHIEALVPKLAAETGAKCGEDNHCLSPFFAVPFQWLEGTAALVCPVPVIFTAVWLMQHIFAPTKDKHE
mmetsp:Transcript_101146/g.200902  ORF Transcript_101146/g.200902 Transcript_101146/m.200902 type:complete len:469 (-) Transcript_101146:19-1425(-)